MEAEAVAAERECALELVDAESDHVQARFMYASSFQHAPSLSRERPTSLSVRSAHRRPLHPVHAGDPLIGLTTKHLLHATGGGLVLVAWTIALALAGITLATRRDVD